MRSNLLYLLIFIFIVIASQAKAITHSSYFGTNLIYSVGEDSKLAKKYEQVTSPEITSLNFGQVFKLKNNIVFNLNTNRLWNKTVKYQILVDDRQFLSKSKLTTDTLLIGKVLHKKYVPSFLISNAELDNKLYQNGNLIHSSTKHTLLYGFNLTSFVDKHWSFSTSYIMSNKEFDLKYALVFGVNYNF